MLSNSKLRLIQITYFHSSTQQLLRHIQVSDTTKHAPTNRGRKTLINPKDISVLVYSLIINSAISKYLSQYQ